MFVNATRPIQNSKMASNRHDIPYKINLMTVRTTTISLIIFDNTFSAIANGFFYYYLYCFRLPLFAYLIIYDPKREDNILRIHSYTYIISAI